MFQFQNKDFERQKSQEALNLGHIPAEQSDNSDWGQWRGPVRYSSRTVLQAVNLSLDPGLRPTWTHRTLLGVCQGPKNLPFIAPRFNDNFLAMSPIFRIQFLGQYKLVYLPG